MDVNNVLEIPASFFRPQGGENRRPARRAFIQSRGGLRR